MKFTKDIIENDVLGKTIKIYPCDNFANGGYGKVTLVDEYGRLHGTWDSRIVVPGEHVFEVIGVTARIRDRYTKIDHRR